MANPNVAALKERGVGKPLRPGGGGFRVFTRDESVVRTRGNRYVCNHGAREQGSPDLQSGGLLSWDLVDRI